MALARYGKNRDHFKADDSMRGLCFPCCCCVYRSKTDYTPPCDECDHNVNANPPAADSSTSP